MNTWNANKTAGCQVHPTEALDRSDVAVDAASASSVQVGNSLALERLLVDRMATFINVPPERVLDQIQCGLQAICEFMEVDCTAFTEFPRDGSPSRRVHWYARQGIQPAPGIIGCEECPWYTAQMQEGLPLVFHRLADKLPGESVPMRRFCLENGLASSLSIPVRVGENMSAIALHSFTRSCQWSDQLISRLRLLGQVFADALAHAHADAVLRDSEQRFRTVADFAYDWEYWITPEGRLLYVSPSCERITGYRPAEFLTDPKLLECIIHEEDRGRFSEHLRTEENSGPHSLDVRLLSRSGEVRWIGHLCQSVYGSRGEYLGRRASNRDITEQKQSQLALETAHAEIRELKNQLQHENLCLRRQIQPSAALAGIIGKDPTLRKLLSQTEKVAKSFATVLITGETGTGKELIASAIHDRSSRRERVMVRVNCAALTPTLIESELFGREKGAYTGAFSKQVGRFELAHGSTLFLDEVGELPLDLQAKLLRALQEGTFERLGGSQTIKVDARVIAASNRDLSQAVREGKFREDLFYRLNVFPLHVPPLRERSEDIPALVWAFVAEFGRSLGKTIEAIPTATIEALQRHRWPGNIRELRNVIERAVIVSEGPTLQVDLPTVSSSPQPCGQTLAEIELAHIRAVLQQTGWRIRGPGGAARILGVKPTTLDSKMSKLGIRRQ